MFELLIAASALSIIIMMFRKQGRILEQKRPIDWAMAGHDVAPEQRAKEPLVREQIQAETPVADTIAPDEPEQEITKEPLDLQAIGKCFRAAETHYARGNLDEAEKMFIKVLSYNDVHPESLNKLGIIYIQQNDLRKAELMFNKLMAQQTKDPTHFANYGRCLYSLERLEEAIVAYEKAIELDNSKSTRYVSLGNMYCQQQRFQEGLAAYSRALELDPYNYEYLTMIADVSELAGDTERLYKTLKKMLDIDPYNYEVKRRFDKIAKG